MHTRTIPIRIKEWFPPDDPIAILAAKLCILREDYLLELAGMIFGQKCDLESRPTYNEYKVGLDENSEGWRRAYFYRNSLKTLFEIRKEIETFRKHPKLRVALARESLAFQGIFKTLEDNITTAEKAVERIRHNLGGHVSRGEIQNVLRHMPDEKRGFLQVGEVQGKTRYKFAAEIILRMMLPGIPEHELLDGLDGLLKETAKLIPIFTTIDELVATYVVNRKLSR